MQRGGVDVCVNAMDSNFLSYGAWSALATRGNLGLHSTILSPSQG